MRVEVGTRWASVLYRMGGMRARGWRVVYGGWAARGWWDEAQRAGFTGLASCTERAGCTVYEAGGLYEVEAPGCTGWARGLYGMEARAVRSMSAICTELAGCTGQACGTVRAGSRGWAKGLYGMGAQAV